MSRDPFDVLRDELLAAERRATATRRSWWRAHRPLLVAAAALALCGTAVAGVLTLTGEDSAPLSGGVPDARRGEPDRYAIVLAPDLRAGLIGWCASVILRGAMDHTGARGCGPATTARSPQIAGGAVTAGPRKILNYLVVDRRVAVVRLADDRRIVPRPDRALPAGWRAAVWFTPRQRGRRHEPALDVALLDRHGHVLPRPDTGVRRLLHGNLPDPDDPPDLPCAIHHPDVAGLLAREQTVVLGPMTRRVDVNGRAFLACAAAVFTVDGERLRAAVLVDAAGPRRAPAQLPGARSFPGHPGVVVTTSGLVGRRVGRAWLVVTGGHRRETQLRVLEALRVDPPKR